MKENQHLYGHFDGIQEKDDSDSMTENLTIFFVFRNDYLADEASFIFIRLGETFQINSPRHLYCVPFLSCIILDPPSPRKKSNTILDKDGTGTSDPTNQTHPPSKVGTFHEMKKLERSFDRFYTILLIVYMLTDNVASQGRQQKNKKNVC